MKSRHTQIWPMVARGMPTKAIANAIGLSEGTVKCHLATLYAALGVNNRTQAAAQYWQDRK